MHKARKGERVADPPTLPNPPSSENLLVFSYPEAPLTLLSVFMEASLLDMID